MERFTVQAPVVRTAETASNAKVARATHHAAMVEAAKNALYLGVNNGINIKIFGAARQSKVPRKNTHGSKDALGKFDNKGNDQTGLALSPWTGKYLAANPCIRLDYNGLVAIDVDHGFEGLSDEEMVAKGELNGLPRIHQRLHFIAGKEAGLTSKKLQFFCSSFALLVR